MPAIPESTRSSILSRLLDHAGCNWPQLAKVQARYHGSFVCITGVLPGGEQIRYSAPLRRLSPLLRLRDLLTGPGPLDDAVLLTGLPIGSPQEAPDTACTLHLTAPGHQHRPDPGPRRTYGATH